MVTPAFRSDSESNLKTSSLSDLGNGAVAGRS
jgi:hypothetical protein